MISTSNTTLIQLILYSQTAKIIEYKGLEYLFPPLVRVFSYILTWIRVVKSTSNYDYFHQVETRMYLVDSKASSCHSFLNLQKMNPSRKMLNMELILIILKQIKNKKEYKLANHRALIWEAFECHVLGDPTQTLIMVVCFIALVIFIGY